MKVHLAKWSISIKRACNITAICQYYYCDTPVIKERKGPNTGCQKQLSAKFQATLQYTTQRITRHYLATLYQSNYDGI